MKKSKRSSDILMQIVENHNKDELFFGEILASLGQRTFGLVLIFFFTAFSVTFFLHPRYFPCFQPANPIGIGANDLGTQITLDTLCYTQP